MSLKNKFDLKKYKKDKKMIGFLFIGILIISIMNIIVLYKTNNYLYGVSLVTWVLFGKMVELEIKQKHILKKLEME